MCIRAALYLRKSKEDQQNSLETQRTEAMAYCKSKGWQVLEEHIYIDDSISRAEFQKRPQLFAMLKACKAKAFDVVVCRDESRLGGDMGRSMVLIGDILDHGVKLVYYYTDETVELNSATDKIMLAVRGFAAELEREKISSRTHEALKVKASKGLAVAGKCFGYRHVEIMNGDKRDRVEYAIDQQQAEVLVFMFESFATGKAVRTIAHELNAKGVLPPQAGKRGTRSWSPSAIRDMLHNDRYLGRVVWNRENEAIYRHGTKHREWRPQDEWIIVEKPELRIISDELWEAVQARFRPTGHKRPRSDGKYLLAGLARCGTCGGPIYVRNTKSGQTIIKGYACKYHRDRGHSVCDCTLIRSVEKVDDVVVEYVESKVLREEVITEALAEVRKRLKERANQPSDVPDLEARETKLNREIHRLTQAIALTDQPLESLAVSLADRERQVRELRARIAVLKAAPSVLDMEVKKLESEARARLADLRGMLRRNPAEGRQALERIFTGPLVMKMIRTPEGLRFEITGRTDTGLRSVPNEIRTRVTALKGPCPGPG